MNKKKREKEVLDETLELARKRGGESRRNADRIAGNVTQGESPDFIVELNSPHRGLLTALAIEHFRADHFSETNVRGGHQDSLAMIEQNRAAKIQKTWSSASFDSDIPQNALDAIGESFAKCLEARFKASYNGYVKSFTNGFNAHIDKLEAYRNNINEKFAHNRAVKIALLIELHSDFSNCFVHDGRSCHKAKPGELLLFDDIVNLLRSQRGGIDYILLGSYEARTNNLVDAAVIRPALLKESLKRNKLPIFRYLGEDRDKPIYTETHIEPSATIVDDRINFELARESQEMPMAERLNTCLKHLPIVIDAHQNKQPFVTTIGMQLLLELYGDILQGMHRINWNDIAIAQSLMGHEEVKRRTLRFEAKWYPDHEQ